MKHLPAAAVKYKKIMNANIYAVDKYCSRLTTCMLYFTGSELQIDTTLGFNFKTSNSQIGNAFIIYELVSLDYS